jgi:hypothetical protein
MMSDFALEILQQVQVILVKKQQISSALPKRGSDKKTIREICTSGEDIGLIERLKRSLKII